MAIPDPISATKIITSLVSLSSNLVSRIKDRKVLEDVQKIYQLIVQLQSQYSALIGENTKLQTEILNLNHEKSELKNNVSALEQQLVMKKYNPESKFHNFERKTANNGVVYLCHKTETKVFACANCSHDQLLYLLPDPSPGSGDMLTYFCDKCRKSITINKTL